MPTLITLPPPADAILVALAFLLPLVLAVGALLACGGRIIRFAPWTVLPALLLSVAEPVSVRWENVLLGVAFATDGYSVNWLFITAILWLCSAWYGSYYLAHDAARARYTFFFLGAMSGNIGLLLARDPAGFFTFFALMSFMSYGLVVHDGAAASRRAGRVYLAMAIIGEVLQFAALSVLFFPTIGQNLPLVFQSLDSLPPPNGWVVGCLLAGFGIKAGLLGLHVWLPMAHPVAPTPASAVLSGSMIKAGLIGWITFLPLGRAAMPEAGLVVVALGLSGAVIAALMGALQTNAKAVLAYSSVSQMGLMTTGIGVALGVPHAWPVMKWVVLVYAAHHAVAKCLLFLSVGLKTTRPLTGLESSVYWGGTIMAALALIGAPLTSGAVAKSLLKEAVAGSGLVHGDAIVFVLTLAAIGTSAMMVRYLMLVRKLRYDAHHGVSCAIWLPWMLLLVMVLGFTFYITGRWWPEGLIPPAKMSLWKSMWPLCAGLGLYALVSLIWQRGKFPSVAIPPGDVVHVLARGMERIIKTGHRILSGVSTEKLFDLQRIQDFFMRRARQVTRVEEELARWTPGAIVFVLIIVVTLWLALG